MFNTTIVQTDLAAAAVAAVVAAAAIAAVVVAAVRTNGAFPSETETGRPGALLDSASFN